MTSIRVLVCKHFRSLPEMPSCVGQGGGPPLAEALQTAARSLGIKLEIEWIRCFGFCRDGPNVRMENGPFFHYTTPDQAEAILLEMLELLQPEREDTFE